MDINLYITFRTKLREGDGKVTEQSFNLVTEPWIKVIEKSQNQEATISLYKLFENTNKYRELAGEMKSQDLAILRLLLAILTTVYSRVDVDGEPYDWLDFNKETWIAELIDDEIDIRDVQVELLQTWGLLYEEGKFTSSVLEYLQKYSDRFSLFGEEPFYQVSARVYDEFVPDNKNVSTGKGTVSVKQMNRLISESNNSPSVFSPKSSFNKENITLPEFTRWIITYQNFTGVTDKTKVNSKDKFSVSSGWLYGIAPVVVKGNDMFDTLMLNMVLNPEKETGIIQKPTWEYSSVDYINKRITAHTPENIAELYTIWSRMLHVEWEDGVPTIFTAGLPKNDNMNAFAEPMTTWKYDKKEASYRPNTKWIKSIGKQMWRNFGNYVATENGSDRSEPGIVQWLELIKEKGELSIERLVELETIGLVSDGNATSQSPAAEIHDNMQINAGVLFDNDRLTFWPARIENTVKLTQDIGDDFWSFSSNLAKLRGLEDSSSFANKLSSKFYDQLNRPFNDWLSSLKLGQEPDEEILKWKKTLKSIAFDEASQVMNHSTPKDFFGRKNDKDTKIRNIFTLYNQFQIAVNKDLA